MNRLAELGSSRELVLNLTLRELRGKYKRSVLGWSWSLINPLATMAIYALVFGVFLQVRVPPGEPSGLDNFPLWLLTGLLTWNFLANSLSGGMEALVSNGNLIKKVWFPREALVMAAVNSFGCTLLIELGVLSAVLLLFGNMVLPWLPLVAIVVAIQYVFLLGLALALSVFNVYFRDVRHFMGIFLQLWFYLTPIVYPVSLVPRHKEILGVDVPVRMLYSLNPMVRFTDIYRCLLYDLRFPPVVDVIYVLGAAMVSVLFGWWVFSRLEGRLAEEI